MLQSRGCSRAASSSSSSSCACRLEQKSKRLHFYKRPDTTQAAAQLHAPWLPCSAQNRVKLHMDGCNAH